MKKNTAIAFLIGCLAFGTAGCSTLITGESTFEIYTGVRVRAVGDVPAKIVVQSDLIDSLSDGEVTEEE